MTTKKAKSTNAAGRARKLKVKKETIRDLDSKAVRSVKGGDVKGGGKVLVTQSCGCYTSSCPCDGGYP